MEGRRELLPEWGGGQSGVERAQPLNQADLCRIPLLSGSKPKGKTVVSSYSAPSQTTPLRSALVKFAPCTCVEPPKLSRPRSAPARVAFVKSHSCKSAPVKRALVKSACRQEAINRCAQYISAFLRLALSKLAEDKYIPCRIASSKHAPDKSAESRFALLRTVLEKSAPAKQTSGSSAPVRASPWRFAPAISPGCSWIMRPLRVVIIIIGFAGNVPGLIPRASKEQAPASRAKTLNMSHSLPAQAGICTFTARGFSPVPCDRRLPT